MAKSFLRNPRQDFRHDNFIEFKSIFCFANAEASLYLSLGFSLLEIFSKFKYSPGNLKSINSKLLGLHEEAKTFCISNNINIYYIEEYMKHYLALMSEVNVPNCFKYINTLAASNDTASILDYAMRCYICTICIGKKELHCKILNYNYLTKEETNAVMANFTQKFSVCIYIYDKPQPEVYANNVKNEFPCLYLYREIQMGQIYNQGKNKIEDIEIVRFSMLYTPEMEDIETNNNFLKSKVEDYPFINKIYKPSPMIKGPNNYVKPKTPLRERPSTAMENPLKSNKNPDALPNANPQFKYQTNIPQIPAFAGPNLTPFINQNIPNTNYEAQPKIVNPGVPKNISNPNVNFGAIVNTKPIQTIPTDVLEILDNWAGLLLKYQISDNIVASQATKLITSYPNVIIPENLKIISSVNSSQKYVPDRIVEFIDSLVKELNKYSISSKDLINHVNQISSEFIAISNLNSIKSLQNFKSLNPQIMKILESDLPQQDVYYCSYGCNSASGIACTCQNQEVYICNSHIKYHFQTGNHNHFNIFKNIQLSEKNEWKNYYNSVRNSILNTITAIEKSLEKLYNCINGKKNSIAKKVEGVRVLIECKLKNLEENEMIKVKDDIFFDVAECLSHINEKNFTQYLIHEILEFVKN
ncbi:hypothetical protein SteCoe_21338 [Stentor coeruleus]|uniref:Uncharacterized protein n=1 Tax=Stentor coeruleus TaxID=5963 RepID=A0A1R2BQ94_9CILI|nr:hypothetical protein SteCoe_21338 [Stentor coeruleus]